MTIGTLEYIHRIMQEDKQRKQDALEKARKTFREKRDAIENGEDGDYEYEENEADAAYNVFAEARNALQEFEGQEW